MNLKNPLLPAFALASVLLFTVKHAAAVLIEISPVSMGFPWLDWVYCCLACVALEFAVFIFAVHSMEKQAVAFAAAILAINVLYFVRNIPAWHYIASGIFAATFAYAVYSFTTLYVSDTKAKAQRAIRAAQPKSKTSARKERNKLRAQKSRLKNLKYRTPEQEDKLNEVELQLAR